MVRIPFSSMLCALMFVNMNNFAGESHQQCIDTLILGSSGKSSVHSSSNSSVLSPSSPSCSSGSTFSSSSNRPAQAGSSLSSSLSSCSSYSRSLSLPSGSSSSNATLYQKALVAISQNNVALPGVKLLAKEITAKENEAHILLGDLFSFCSQPPTSQFFFREEFYTRGKDLLNKYKAFPKESVSEPLKKRLDDAADKVKQNIYPLPKPTQISL